MAQIAPVAPKSFYATGLQGLKDALEATNGSTKGQLTLISAIPDDFTGVWAEVGAGGDGTVGSLVLGHKELVGISEIEPGDAEAGSTETGYKLIFDPVPDVNGIAVGTSVAIALIVGRDTLTGGSDADVLYVTDMVDLAIAIDTKYNVPEFEIEIGYGQNKV